MCIYSTYEIIGTAIPRPVYIIEPFPESIDDIVECNK